MPSLLSSHPVILFKEFAIGKEFTISLKVVSEAQLVSRFLTFTVIISSFLIKFITEPNAESRIIAPF